MTEAEQMGRRPFQHGPGSARNRAHRPVNLGHCLSLNF